MSEPAPEPTPEPVRQVGAVNVNDQDGCLGCGCLLLFLIGVVAVAGPFVVKLWKWAL